MDILSKITEMYTNKNLPLMKIGDTLKIFYRVVEGGKERTQPYEGVLIARKGVGVSKTITVRKVSYGVGVERVFPVNSPRIEKVEILKHAKVRRAKLYYLRNIIGKKAKLKEQV